MVSIPPPGDDMKNLLDLFGQAMQAKQDELKAKFEPQEEFVPVQYAHSPGMAAGTRRRILLEASSRICEALSLWEPQPHQAPFHASLSHVRLALGGNRSGKEQPIDEPVLTPTGWKMIGALEVGDQVIGGDGNPCNVTGVFPQGEKDVLRVTFGDGAWTRCGKGHLWKCRRVRDHEWRVLTTEEIRDIGGDRPDPTARFIVPSCVANLDEQQVPLDPYLVGALIGDGSLGADGVVCLTTADSQILRAVSDALPAGVTPKYIGQYDYRLSISGWKTSDGQHPLAWPIRQLGLRGKRSHEKFVPPQYLWNSASVRMQVLRGLMDTDGTAPPSGANKKTLEFSTSSPRLAKDIEFLVRSLGGQARTTWRLPTYRYKGQKKTGRPSARVNISMALNPFALDRKAERFQPITRQRRIYEIDDAGRAECVCIAVDSPDQTYVTRDFIVTHNTSVGAAEATRAVLGRDPFGKYPRYGGTGVFVSKDNDTIASTFYEKLFEPGAFKVIRDEHTGLWRSVRPWLEYDQAYREKWKPAPPLIPERLCNRKRDIAWEDRKKGVLRRFRIPSTGWKVYVFSGESTPKTGYAVHLAWMDEEARDDRWYPELETRTIDYEGRIFVTATPLAGSVWLADLYARWEAHDEYVSVLHLDQDQNLHTTEQAKKAAQAGLTQEQLDIRVRGKLSRAKQLIFPEFDIDLHGCSPFEIPPHWTVYVGIDPGNVPATAVFLAVPPPDDEAYGMHVYLYDELVLFQSSADKFAQAMKKRVGDRPVERFLIDMRFARQREAGSGDTTLRHYQDAFARHNIQSERQGADFTAGCDDPEARIESIHELLRGATPKLKYFKDRCPVFVDQMRRYMRKRDSRGNLSDQIVKRNDHTIDALGYLASFRPTWVAPGGGTFLSRWQQFQQSLLKKAGLGGGFSFSARG